MDISYLQLVLATSCLMLAFLLLLSPYYDRRFAAYTTARKLLILSQLVLFVQFALQFVFKIRQSNPDLGAAVNHFFYIPAALLVYFSMLLCSRGTRLQRSDVIAGALLWATDVLVLTVGLLFRGGEELHHFNAASFVLSVVMVLFFTLRVNITIRKVRREVQSFYANPVSSYTSWMSRATMVLILVPMFSFFAAFDGRFMLISASLYWLAITYYVISFDHFGYYLREGMQDMREQADEAAPAAEPTEEQADDSPLDTTILSAVRQQRLDTWVHDKGYCANGISIIELARIVGTNRTTLSQYINTTMQLPFRDWINQLRCEEAKRMMSRDPSLPIDDVADRCGFSSRKYFDQVFSAYAGKTPAAFRDGFKL